MSRDPNLVKRNAFVIPGALLALVCLVGILYGMLLRPDPGYGCAYGGAGMLLWSQCYHVATVFTPPLVLAAFLILFGLLRYRGHPEDLEDHLHPGTGQHVLLALILGIIALPLVLWIGIKYAERQDDVTYILPALGTRYEMSFLLEVAMLLGILMLLPFLVAYLAHGRMRRDFLHAAQELTRDTEGSYDDQFTPLGDDEAMVPLPEDEHDGASAWPEEGEDEPWQDLPVGEDAEQAPLEDQAGEEDLHAMGEQEPMDDGSLHAMGEQDPLDAGGLHAMGEPTDDEGPQAAEEPGDDEQDGPWLDDEGEANETPEQQLEPPAYRAVRARPEDTFGDDPDAAPLADEWDDEN